MQSKQVQEQFPELKQLITLVGSQAQPIVVQGILAVIFGGAAVWLRIPVAWLLGPMIAAIIYSLSQERPQPLPPFFMTGGKAILGLATAVRFSPETLSVAVTYALPLLGCILMTAGLSLCSGYLVSRWTGLDRTTGLLSFIPGMASTIVAIGEDMGADAVSIALLQYVRVLLVVLIIPSLAKFLLFTNPTIFNAELAIAPSDIDALGIKTLATTPTSIGSPDILFNASSLELLVLAALCLLGNWLGQKLRLPASGYLGTFILGLIFFWSSPYPLDVPQWLFSLALLWVGLSIGSKFNWQSAKKLWKAVAIEIVLVSLLSLACLVIGYGFHLITHVDTVTSVLGFTPGGLEAMIATVMQLGGDTGLVLAMQLTRMLLIILLGPWLITFFTRRTDRTMF